MKLTGFLLLTLLLTTAVEAEHPESWIRPVEPFRIIDSIYYVGTADLASYLITTPAGHILLDAPMEENVPHLLRSIRTLGFDPARIEIMINSHAHFDHAGGFARMKEISGARLLVSAEDAKLLERGGRNDFAFGDTAAFTPVEVDEIISDSQDIELGSVRLRMVATPGHTMGGTSWVMEIEEDGRALTVLFANSMSAPDYDLVDNVTYPQIMADYRKSFERLEQIDADVFLSTHGSFFKLLEKMDEVDRGSASNPFVRPGESRRFVERWRGIIENRYTEQQESRMVNRILDEFHDAAARADGEAYFSLFAPDGIFIGTDAGERWSVEEFRVFAEPYFDRGQGWTYVPLSRHVYVDASADTAWFDEILENASYGTTRGTGVLVKRGERWKIAQYHLTIPIPNEIAKDVVEMIRR